MTTKIPTSKEVFGLSPAVLKEMVHRSNRIKEIMIDPSEIKYEKGKNLYVRNIPTGLYYRLKNLQRHLNCITWESFFYEVDRIMTEYRR